MRSTLLTLSLLGAITAAGLTRADAADPRPTGDGDQVTYADLRTGADVQVQPVRHRSYGRYYYRPHTYYRPQYYHDHGYYGRPHYHYRPYYAQPYWDHGHIAPGVYWYWRL